MWNMWKKFFIKVLQKASYIITLAFTLLPESVFKEYVLIDIPLLLAPMAGVTDPPYREIISSFGYVGLVFSEMIASKSLFIGNRAKSISKIKNNS